MTHLTLTLTLTRQVTQSNPNPNPPGDSVFLGFLRDPKMYELKPGMLALFPGYLLQHKTVRPIVPLPAPRRFSLVLFMQFKRGRAADMHKYLRQSYQLID